MSYRPDWWPNHDGYENKSPYSVLEIVDQLHAANTGASDLAPEWCAELERALVWFRENMKKPPWTMWDRALETLVHRTLMERKPKAEGPPDLIQRR